MIRKFIEWWLSDRCWWFLAGWAFGAFLVLMANVANAEWRWLEPNDNLAVFLCGERVEGFFPGTTVEDLLAAAERCDAPVMGPSRHGKWM